MVLGIVLLLLATVYRMVAVFTPDLSNFSPLMAIAFCGAVYFRDKRLWLVPFLALTGSDLFIDHYYANHFGYHWTLSGPAVRGVCFVAALALGWMVSQRKSWLNLFSGALGSSVFFYIVTNTGSWVGDEAYAKTVAGWWQALTVGHPEFPPTLFFFRNTLVSDLLFTGIFAFAMEYAAQRKAQPSLLVKPATR